MLAIVLMSLYLGLPLLLSGFLDPGPGVFSGTNGDSSERECALLTGENARQRLLAANREGFARGIFIGEDVIDCRSRVVATSDRPARVEALLASISTTVPELVKAARLKSPSNTIWRVEVIHSDVVVAEKIANAAKTHLAELHESVLDLPPVLSAVGIQKFQQARIVDGMPILCEEFAGGIKGGEKVLGIVQLNPAETIWHAGLCSNTGDWQWLL